MANIWNRYVESAAERFGVPPALVNSVINVESAGRPGAVSGAGAGGYMQLMPGTYGDLAKQYGFGPDRMDPANNINAGTAYMAQLYKQFGNWPDALAAYNAGPNRWRQVQAGKAEAPRETQAYVPKVLAGFEQGKGADVPLFSSNRGPTDEDAARWSNSPFGNLLNFGQDKNFYEGLGGLLNAGQEPSHPPRTDPAALPGTTQTDRLGVGSRMNDLLQQLLQQPQKSAMSPLQYQLAGAGSAVGELAGVHNRRVGIGEMLGALGGGMTRGALAGEEAQRGQVAGELDKLLKVGAYQNQERTASLNEANSVFDNQLKQAQTAKALAPTSDADRYKVVGKHVYDTQTKQFIAAPDAGGDGTFAGNAAEVQGVNALIKAGKITPEQGALWLSSKTATGPNGQFDVINPLSTPGAGGAQGAAPPAPGAAPAGGNPGVTTVRPGVVVPTNEQNLNAGFANRLYAANTELDALEQKGEGVPSLYDRGVSEIPILGNYATTNGYQQLTQAQREFINAQLRRESGAAISPSEFENARQQYFPQPGDKDDVLAQKRRSRNMAIANMAQSAGPAKIGFDPPKVTMPEGAGAGGDGGAPKILRFDAQGNIIQ